MSSKEKRNEKSEKGVKKVEPDQHQAQRGQGAFGTGAGAAQPMNAADYSRQGGFGVPPAQVPAEPEERGTHEDQADAERHGKPPRSKQPPKR